MSDDECASFDEEIHEWLVMFDSTIPGKVVLMEESIFGLVKIMDTFTNGIRISDRVCIPGIQILFINKNFVRSGEKN